VSQSFRESLPVALNLRGRNALVLGGGDEALDKVRMLRSVGARVTLVAERAAPELAQLARRGELIWYARGFQESDLIGTQLCLLSDPDAALAQQLRALKVHHPFWLCAVDQPAYSDLFLVSIVARGPLQIGISTGGGAPLLARRMRQALEAGLDQRFSQFARRFADLRASLRALPKPERKQRLEGALEGFAMHVTVSYPGTDE
jgi:uroporphyrin-III C-methyltransferase / precorrin-2 dehydrogenase / sirohydrochlorin ferrochelatase